MKKIFAVLMLLSFVGLQAQTVRNCGAMEHLDYLKSLDPDVESRMQAIEVQTAKAINTGEVAQKNGNVISIPVVVHVVYKSSSQNISDTQIQSQIDVLNEDFRRLNADATNNWSQAADSEIEFCLASVDPNGNATTGITRKYSSTSLWSTNDAVKYSSSGGVNAWPTSDYLNIWVAPLSGGTLGYAQFPGSGSSATDGVVITTTAFGRGGSAQSPFNLGRTCTHEVGHWLNLRHIWGDGGCSVDDYVSDTPTSDAANYGCASGHVSCNSTDMVENYMDYSDDVCMNLYTQGQKIRMRALFASGGARASLLNSNGCGSAGGGPTGYCASQGNSVQDEWIANVQIGSFSNASGAQLYSDFTAQTVNVYAGQSYSVTLTPAYSGSTYNEYFKIWVDFNNDDDFEDAGEELFGAGPVTAATSGSIAIPSSAGGVTTRMRVSMKYNAAPSSCETFDYGEVEDYTIAISAAQATCGVSSGLNASGITTDRATLNWGAVSGAFNYDVRFRQVGSSSWASGTISGTSATATGLTAGTDYEFQVRTNCTNGAASAYSALEPFTTLNPSSSGGCTGGISAFPYSESFENGFGAWTQASGDDFDWTRRSGSTPSSGTGPSSASQGSYYVYTESSNPNYSSKTAILNGPCFDLSNASTATFTFKYHMYGASNMGNLKLEASTDDGATWTSVWSKASSQSNSWLSASVDLSSYTGDAVQLRFNGTTGTTWKGDMAVDNVGLSTSSGGGSSCHDVTLTIKLDNYPEETSWAIKSASGTTVASGGTYGSQSDGSTLTETACLPAGCYEFIIYDSYGDGICCSYGNGNYNLSEDGAGTLASGASFGSSESTSFCVPGGGSRLAQGGNVISTIAETATVKVFPNPVRNNLTVTYKSKVNGTSQMKVYDMTGRIVLNQEVGMQKGENETNVNLSDLPYGTYIMEVFDGKARTSTRFVKMK